MSDEEQRLGLTDAEERFIAALLERHPKAQWFRHGWPDFLVEEDGLIFAVEVKHANDPVRPRQARIFEALERAGVSVYVWHTGNPRRLLRWKHFVETSNWRRFTKNQSPAKARRRARNKARWAAEKRERVRALAERRRQKLALRIEADHRANLVEDRKAGIP